MELRWLLQAEMSPLCMSTMHGHCELLRTEHLKISFYKEKWLTLVGGKEESV